MNSGQNVNVQLPITQAFADGLNANLAGATIKVLTDFQKTPVDVPIPADERNPTSYNDASSGTMRERELQVELWIGINKFVVVERDTSTSFEQSWFYDSTSRLMAGTVSYSSIYMLGSGKTLAQFLTENPVHAGDSWTLNYSDNDGGSFQARTAKFEFYYNDPGDPGIVVVGDSGKSNLIYGTSGNDTLTGGALDDTIIGRGGNDLINGGGGHDTLRGGGGNDRIDGGAGNDLLDLSDATAGVTFTLVQGSSDTTVNLTSVGLGTDTYRNIEGLIGSDYGDTLTGSASDDQIYGGRGADTIIVGGGNDMLYGGAGADHMAGGGGGDTFVIGSDAPGIEDVITDYNYGDGDAVDLSELLGSLPSNTTLENNYVRVQDAGGDNANLQVDTDGAGNGGWHTVAVLEDFQVSTDVVKILFNNNGTKTEQDVH
ncbi:MAG: type I secretion C-terminal target domain-containing protein [Ensifer adhaerens]|nr:type I secretion C-terminal target domain-containing protein [Ensifer adhaerens]